MKSVRERLEALERPNQRPRDSFTRAQYEQWFNLSTKAAGKRLREYVILGRIKRGGSGTATYYTIEEGNVRNGSVPSADEPLGTDKRQSVARRTQS